MLFTLNVVQMLAVCDGDFAAVEHDFGVVCVTAGVVRRSSSHGVNLSKGQIRLSNFQKVFLKIRSNAENISHFNFHKS